MSSTNFNVIAIYILTEDARCADHDGKPYFNTEFPKGSIIAIGEDGVVMAPRRQQDIVEGHDADAWPQPVDGKIDLWRDHWKVLGGAAVSYPFPTGGLLNIAPYSRAVLVTQKKLVTGRDI